MNVEVNKIIIFITNIVIISKNLLFFKKMNTDVEIYSQVFLYIQYLFYLCILNPKQKKNFRRVTEILIEYFNFH